MLEMDTVTQYAVKYGLQALVAIGIFIAGVLVARWAGKLMQQALERQTLEPPVRMLLVRIVKIIVLLFAAVIALEALGVPIAPLVAGIGVATRTRSTSALLNMSSTAVKCLGTPNRSAVAAARSGTASTTASTLMCSRASGWLKCGRMPRCETLPQPTSAAHRKNAAVSPYRMLTPGFFAPTRLLAGPIWNAPYRRTLRINRGASLRQLSAFRNGRAVKPRPRA